MILKARWIQICIILGTLLFVGCFDPPDFSNVPEISFRSLRYIEYEDAPDSMLLQFDFRDGNGDIGIDDDYFQYPFHRFNLIIDSRDSLVTISDPDVVPPFYVVDPAGQRELFSETDNRPPFNNCDYFFNADVIPDTLFIQENEFSNNFHIEFLERKNGQYSKVFFSNSTCDVVDFDGRIPIFDSEHNGQSLTGTITYRLYSQGFPIILTPDTFKIRFYLYDRELNPSNVVESPEFLFQDILETR
jgi:hypothetical protein